MHKAHVDPISRAIDPGTTATYHLAFTPSAAFTGNVLVTASSPSPSLTLQLPAIAFPLPGTIMLTATNLHPPGSPAVWYSIPITATGGSVTHVVNAGVLIGGVKTYLPIARR